MNFTLPRAQGLMLFVLSLSIACSGEDPSKPGTIDEELPDDTGGDGGDGGGGDGVTDCTVGLSSISPASGSSDISYRAELVAVFESDVRDLGPVFSLTDSAGASVPVNFSFDDTGLVAAVTPASGALGALETYTFGAAVCNNQLQTQFTTALYGGPLEVEPAALVGNTYHFDLGGAEYLEPEGLGGVLATFLTDPLLIGIADASATALTIQGTQGRLNVDTGAITQRSGFDVWDFGSASFTDQPYFESAPADISINYSGAEIPMYDFKLSGTFAPDGSSIGFATASGIGDSRNMGPLVGLGSDPSAVCDLAAGFGVTCEACPDGGRYCVRIEALFEPAPLVPDLTLVP